MTIEHKFISLAEFKATDEGTGTLEGYITTFGELDDVGDIILAGAYTDTIPQFRRGGFNADTHQWKFGDLIGYPTDAREDEVGFFSKAAFHSTQPAQNARIIARERMKAGLDVFTSIGYELSAPPIMVRSADYSTELPKYSAPNLVQQNLENAQRFAEVRVIPKVKLHEWSLVPVPALSSAMLTAVKSHPLGLVDGLEYGDYLLTVVDAVRDLSDRTEKRITLRTKEGRVLSSANVSELSSAADELETLLKRIRTLLESAAPKPKEDEEQKSQSFDIQQVVNHLMVMDLQLQGVPIR